MISASFARRHVQRRDPCPADARPRRRLRRLRGTDLLHERDLPDGAGGAGGVLRRQAEVLVVEEGQPAFIEEQLLATLRRADAHAVKVRGKDVLPMAGEYTGEVVLTGLARFLGSEKFIQPMKALKQKAAELLGGLPQRPPGFCVGCPERPVFSAMKLLEQDTASSTCPPTSAATCSRRCRRSISAIRCSATGSGWLRTRR